MTRVGEGLAWRTPWFALMLAASCWLCAAVAPAARSTARAQTSNVPADVAAALPQGATVVMGASGDLTNQGQTDWAVVYTLPVTLENGVTIARPSLAILLPSASGWTVSATVTMDFGVGANVYLAGIGDTNAAVFTAGVGAHAERMIILRWNGKDFHTIFDQTDNTPGLQLVDVDGDGVPEVVKEFSSYCEAYVTAPRLVEVWGWNGFQYVEDTNRYPGAIATAWTDVTNAFTRANTDGWRPDGIACLHGALAYLADKAGDQQTANAECAKAHNIDPTWSAEWAPAACGAAG